MVAEGGRAGNLRHGLYGLVACLILSQPAWSNDWPRFRGPHGAGSVSNVQFPTEWELDDYAWTTELDGLGHSSPAVRDERLYVTSASSDGTRRHLYCLETDTGDIAWKRTISLAKDSMHRKGSYASGTPALSAHAVFVTFADNDHQIVAAFSLDGAPQWRRDLGPFQGEHGHGASPIVWNGIVIVPNDQDVESSYVALEASTGETIWKSPRNSGVASYSTPLILENPGEPPQLITSSDGEGVASLDPATGEVLWRTGSLPQRTVSSPIAGGGLVFQTCGVGGRGRLLVGVDPTLSGEVDSRVVLKVDKQLPYVPTPLYHDGLLFLWGDGGVAACLRPPATEPVWVGQVHGDYSASPIRVGEILYNVSESGEVVAIRAASKFEILGRSPLGEPSQATPAVADGRMFFHTEHHVLCLESGN